MPRGDGTGPVGQGPMSGRAGGYCAGFGMPGFANPIPGCGLGRGRRRGFGRKMGLHRGFAWGAAPCYGFGPRPVYPEYQHPYARMSVEEERQMLQSEASYLRDTLSEIEQRLKDLEEKEERASE